MCRLYKRCNKNQTTKHVHLFAFHKSTLYGRMEYFFRFLSFLSVTFRSVNRITPQSKYIYSIHEPSTERSHNFVDITRKRKLKMYVIMTISCIQETHLHTHSCVWMLKNILRKMVSMDFYTCQLWLSFVGLGIRACACLIASTSNYIDRCTIWSLTWYVLTSFSLSAHTSQYK